MRFLKKQLGDACDRQATSGTSEFSFIRDFTPENLVTFDWETICCWFKSSCFTL